LQVLRTDNKGEFTSHILKDVCSRLSVHQFTAPYSPHQISVAEREWRIHTDGHDKLNSACPWTTKGSVA
ncbi:unnamed protein product, partial [Discosporangium mesarthrocarpum]